MTIVLISGPAGSGTTALARRTAATVKDACADEPFYIDLRGNTPGQLPMHPVVALQLLLAQAGVQDEGLPRWLSERSVLWHETLARRNTVLLLDNAASITQLRPLPPVDGTCTVIVTSSRRIPGLEARSTVSLDEPDGGAHESRRTPRHTIESLLRLVDTVRQ